MTSGSLGTLSRASQSPYSLNLETLHTKTSQPRVVIPQALRTGRQVFGRGVIFWLCHTVSPTAHLPFSTWHLCFDLALEYLQGPRTEGPATCHQGWRAAFYFQSFLCGLPANFISLILAFPSATPSPMTVVCYQSDRDELRRRVIQWLEAEIIPDGWFSKGSNYSEVLDKYFKASRAVPASEAREHFLPCHCKAAAMSPARRPQCVMGL